MGSAVDYAAYTALLAARGGLHLLPLGAARALLEGLAHLFGRLDYRRRPVVHRNLRQAFPDWPDSKIRSATAQAYANWGRIAAELAHVDELASPDVLALWQGPGERVDRLQERGRGVLLLTAHTGNFELMARLWGLGNRRVSVFYRPMTNRYVDRLLLDERSAGNVDSIGRGVAVRGALRVLRDGGVLAVPLDQNQKRARGIFVDVFGKPACTSTLLARLSLAARAPVVPMFSVWEGRATLPVMGEVVEPEGPDSPAAGADDREEKIRLLTERYNEEIEDVVRRYPEQWNWAHDRWRTRPEPTSGDERAAAPDSSREPVG